MMIDDAVRGQVQRLVRDLVLGNIEEIVGDGRGGRNSVEGLRRAIYDYPGTLTMPPDNAFEALDLTPLENERVPTYFLHFELWVDGELSDLTLTCTVSVQGLREAAIVIDDLHVL